MEIVFGLTIFGLCVLLFQEKQKTNELVTKLTNALIAKTATEAAQLDATDKVRVVKTEAPQNDLVLESELDDAEFDKLHNIDGTE